MGRRSVADLDRIRPRGGDRPGQDRGATDLNEDAQDSQALRPLSSLTQALIGIRIIVYDVELR